ncbi:MAG: sodium-dependent transporter [Gammaproteobacteria bacterium]|nr:sodium-dependent transporter [Gammaproteobacteria bacterium]MBQ0840357.1 sodium-dependent transporter [Gammaproteobacteria bacterium]
MREQWSRGGFLLAAVGSAAGLGNIWRFSYVAGENGGAAFLIIYMVAVIFIGLPLVIAELAIGRRGRDDAVATLRHQAPGKHWYIAGGLSVVGAFFILGFYSLIAGWALKYFIGAVDGSLWAPVHSSAYGAYFKAFIARPYEPLIWQLLMIAITTAVVAAGIRHGIEAANRLLMPILGLIIIALAVYSLNLDGAEKGLEFLFSPDWSAFSRPAVYIAAIGQAFFSLGIGMAIFLTYGSYLDPGQSIGKSACIIVLGDSLLAITAGLAIFPAVFAFGIDPAEGPELAFITLPGLFSQMPGGRFIGTLFFGLLAGAALTSMFSILEVPSAYLARRMAWSRRKAVCLAALLSFLAGLPPALGFALLEDITINGRGLLDTYDYAVSHLLLPTGGILIALFTGWGWGKSRALEASGLLNSPLGKVWLFSLRYISPVVILAVFMSA